MTLEDMLYVMQPKEDFLRSMDYLYDVKQFYEPLCSEFHLEYREIKEWKCIVLIGDGFIITAFCLRNKWSNILRGDKSWIEKAKGSVWFAELPLTNPPSDYMVSLIK